MGIRYRQLPGQEYLGAIPVGGEVGHIEAATAALDDGVRLAGVEYHRRTPDQGDSMARRGKMQVQTLVLAQEEIAKGRSAILCAVMVVLRAAAGHQCYVTGGKHLMQTERARPVGHTCTQCL